MKPPLDIAAWLKSGRYLPPLLRDFHDQKDLFRTMHTSVSPANQSIKEVDWMRGQCYVIDIFLWWMARRGYTLQKTRLKGDFHSIGADIKAYQTEQADLLKGVMRDRVRASRIRDEPEGTHNGIPK